MDDTISRQAAIRWVKTECNPYGKPTLDFESGKKVIAHLEQMPSAQPDTDSRIEQAIRVLQKNYNLALSRDYIRNPIAWALYETWKEFDR